MDAIDKIIERIKKAVRLANKTTEAGERETAMRLARNLAEKNGIAFDEIEIEREAVGAAHQEEEGELKSADMAVDGRICGVLRNHFAVVMMMHLYKTRRKVRYTYFGSRLNIDIAKYVADILRREAKKAWRDARRDVQCGIFNIPLKRADFMAGFFFRIHQKLEENPIRNDRDQVAAESKKAEELFNKYKESNTVNETKPKMGNNMASRILGFDSAERVSLNRPCGNGMPSAGAIGKQEVLGLRV